MKKGKLKIYAVLLAITCFASGFVACGETTFSSNGTENSTSSENSESNGTENSESNRGSSSSSAEEGESLNKTRLTIGVEESDYGYEWLGKLVDAFEEKYEQTSFKDGEKGVKVMIDRGTVGSNDIGFLNNDNLLYETNITDVLTENNILDKLLLAPCEKDGQYYTLP